MIIGPPGKGARNFPTGIVVGLSLILLAGGAGAWYLSQPRTDPAQAVVLTTEAKAYVRSLKLSGVEMKATDSAMANLLVEIVGSVTNNGDRRLRLVELHTVFYDAYSQVVLRERVAIVRPKEGPLGPGETRQFRMPFDSLPKSWNQAMPQLVIAQIQFE